MGKEINRIIVSGRAGKDGEAKGEKMAIFSLALSNNKKVNGEWVDGVIWFDCVCFGYAKEAALNVQKGARLIVDGRLDQREWTKDGEKHTSLQIIVDSVVPLDAPQTTGRKDVDKKYRSAEGDDDLPF